MTRSRAHTDEHTSLSPCRQCGYDLSGLAESAMCPECGCGVADSLRILLRNSPPEYLARIRKGAARLRIFVWILVGYLLLAVCALIAYAMLSVFASPRTLADAEALWSNPHWWHTAIGWIIGLVMYWFFIAGWWNLSSQIPDAPLYDQPKRRKAVRVSLTIYTVSYLLSFALQVASLLVPLLLMISYPIGVVSTIASIVLTLNIGPLLGSIATRIPNPDTVTVARRYHRLAIAMLISLAVLMAFGMLAVVFMAAAQTPGPSVLLFAFGGIAFALLALLTLGRYCSMSLKFDKALRAMPTDPMHAPA